MNANWIKDRDTAETFEVLWQLIPGIQIGILLVAATIAFAVAARRGERVRSERHGDLRDLAGLGGLLLTPLVLIAFSLLVQPALIPRYAIVTIAGFAPLLALLASLLPRWLRLAAAVACVALGVLDLRAFATTWHDSEHGKAAQIAAIRQQPAQVIVVFEAVQDLSPVLFYAPDLVPRCYVVDFEDPEVVNNSRWRRHSRDLARCFARFYPQYHLITLDEVRRRRQFILLPRTVDVSDFEGYRWVQIGERVFGMTRN